MKKPPSKLVIFLAIAPIVVFAVCMFSFMHFNVQEGVTATIIALPVYYVIFGIVYAVKTLKSDKKRAEDMGDLTREKYEQLQSEQNAAQSEYEYRAAAEDIEIAEQYQVDKTASRGEKIGTIFLMIAVVLVTIGAFVGAAMEYYTVTWICIGAFLGIIFLTVIIIALSSHVRKTPPRSANLRGTGVCLYCSNKFGMSFLSFKGGRPGYDAVVTYKLIVVIDGRKLTAYSHTRSFRGEQLQIAYSAKSKKCYIL